MHFFGPHVSFEHEVKNYELKTWGRSSHFNALHLYLINTLKMETLRGMLVSFDSLV